jgi:GNAT superfamily N-acetyltransferase
VIFCDLNLAQRLESAEAAAGAAATHALARIHPESGAAVESIGGGRAMFAGKTSPITQAFCVGLYGPVSDAEMDRLEDFFHSRGAAVNIEHSPHADLSVAGHYASRGYYPIEFSNTLFRPMDERGRPADPATTGSDQIEIRPITTAEANLWTRTVCEGFAEQIPITPELLETVTCFVYSSLATCFLALVNGTPAGGAALGIHEGVAIVNGASTLPQYRNRGIQTALLQTRLAYAAEKGCDLAMTNTGPGTLSQRNVERQGFRVAHSRTKYFHP